MLRIAAEEEILAWSPESQSVRQAETSLRLQAGRVEDLYLDFGPAVVDDGVIGQQLRRDKHLLVQKNQLLARGRHLHLPVLVWGTFLRRQALHCRLREVWRIDVQGRSSLNHKAAGMRGQHSRDLSACSELERLEDVAVSGVE